MLTLFASYALAALAQDADQPGANRGRSSCRGCNEVLRQLLHLGRPYRRWPYTFGYADDSRGGDFCTATGTSRGRGIGASREEAPPQRRDRHLTERNPSQLVLETPSGRIPEGWQSDGRRCRPESPRS
jgi:hypothetical protein